MFYEGGDDDDQQIKQDPEDKGGSASGHYGPSDPDLTIPGETEGIDNSQL